MRPFTVLIAVVLMGIVLIICGVAVSPGVLIRDADTSAQNRTDASTEVVPARANVGATTTRNGYSAASPTAETSNRLLGTWLQADSPSKTEVHTLEFRDDGTFRETSNGLTDIYDSGESSDFEATGTRHWADDTTGTWTVILASSQEIEGRAIDNETAFPTNGLLLREDVGIGTPWYFSLTLAREGTELVLKKGHSVWRYGKYQSEQ
ncbi:hypothetical protein [Bradyrhizobium sp. CCBAU 65884]|uniref:hypothetical protein n=1 Tax=Bradyrhizobium sp. CCBAU 65884 TaxID=722477 RepID=UPI002306A500|nr:hypothetical protein [Bradyrhizobium sp. CCBAU 65884]